MILPICWIIKINYELEERVAFIILISLFNSASPIYGEDDEDIHSIHLGFDK